MMAQRGDGRLAPTDKADGFWGCGEWESRGAKQLGGLTRCLWFQPGKSVMTDVCTTCHCSVHVGAVSEFNLECKKTICPVCSQVRQGCRAPGGWAVWWWDPSHGTSLGFLDKAFIIFSLWTVLDNNNEESKSSTQISPLRNDFCTI